jgi:hypothetical protein
MSWFFPQVPFAGSYQPIGVNSHLADPLPKSILNGGQVATLESSEAAPPWTATIPLDPEAMHQELVVEIKMETSSGSVPELFFSAGDSASQAARN